VNREVDLWQLFQPVFLSRSKEIILSSFSALSLRELLTQTLRQLKDRNVEGIGPTS
jgi:hypothetical protein